MAIFKQPVGIDPLDDQREDMAGEVFRTDPGEYEKAGIVGQHGKILFTGLGIPSDIVIPVPAFPGCRSEQETSQDDTVPASKRLS